MKLRRRSCGTRRWPRRCTTRESSVSSAERSATSCSALDLSVIYTLSRLVGTGFENGAWRFLRFNHRSEQNNLFLFNITLISHMCSIRVYSVVKADGVDSGGTWRHRSNSTLDRRNPKFHLSVYDLPGSALNSQWNSTNPLMPHRDRVLPHSHYPIPHPIENPPTPPADPKPPTTARSPRARKEVLRSPLPLPHQARKAADTSTASRGNCDSRGR